jgi:hypothetical protein
VIVALAVIGSVLTMIVPSRPEPVTPLQLASPSAPAGTVGGLLPATSFTTVAADGTATVHQARVALHPAVLAFIPQGCTCHDVIRSLHGQAVEFRLPLYVVTDLSPAQAAPLVAATSTITHDDAYVIYDTTGELSAPFVTDSLAVSVVAVHSDGVIGSVRSDVDARTRLESVLRDLAGPGTVAGR